MNADLAPTLPGGMSLSRRSVATTCIVGLLGGSALLGPHASAERLPNMGNPLAPSLALAQVAPGLPAGPNPAGPGAESTAPGAEPTAPGPEPGVRSTNNCEFRLLPPPAVSTSEIPAPGETSPAPLPTAEQPVGGAKMGECGEVTPAGFEVPAQLSATSWAVIDLDQGTVIAAKDPHGRYRPASIIKILLALVAIEELQLDDTITAVAADANMVGSRVGIVEGVDYRVETLLLGLLLNSGNDCGNALARALGGWDSAIAKVNAKAISLGATDTRVVNPTGLDAPGQSTSAYDMGLFVREAFNDPTYRKLSSVRLTTIPGDPELGVEDFEIANDNQLLVTDYPGALGGKTGFTDDARHTFVGVAEQAGRRLGAIILDATVVAAPRPHEQAALLLDAGFAAPAEAHVGKLVAAGVPQPDSDERPYWGLFENTPGQEPRLSTWTQVAVGLGVVAVVALIGLATWWSGKRRR